MKINNKNKQPRTIEEIRELLVKGDIKLISHITGFVPQYIEMVLKRERNSARVIEVANEVINNRAELINRLQTK